MIVKGVKWNVVDYSDHVQVNKYSNDANHNDWDTGHCHFWNSQIQSHACDFNHRHIYRWRIL